MPEIGDEGIELNELPSSDQRVLMSAHVVEQLSVVLAHVRVSRVGLLCAQVEFFGLCIPCPSARDIGLGVESEGGHWLQRGGVLRGDTHVGQSIAEHRTLIYRRVTA